MTFSDWSNKKKKKVEEVKPAGFSSSETNNSGVNSIALGAKKSFDSAAQIVRQESKPSQPYISHATIRSGGPTFDAWSDRKYGNTRNVSDWVRDTYDAVNRLGDYYSSYKVRDDEKYQSYQKELSDLLSEGEKWRGIHDNESSIAEINSVTDMLSNNKRYAARARNYWGQWETEEDYNAAMERQKQYDELRNYDVAAGEKEIAEIQAIKDEYMSLSDQAGYGKFSPIMYQSPLTRFDDKTKGQIDKRLAEIEEQYGDIDSIKNSLSEKKTYLAEAKRLQDGIRLSSVNNPDSEFYDPDFKEYSVFNDQEQDDLYAFINGDSEYQWEYKTKAESPGIKDFLGVRSEYTDKNYQYMTDDEIGIFNYYYAKDGKDAARQYLDSIQETLNYRSGGIMRAGVYDSKPLQLIFGLQTDVDNWTEGFAENLSRYITGANEYKPVSDTKIASSMVRDDISKDGLVWQIAYDAASSIGNMLPSILVTSMVGAVNPFAGSIAGKAAFAGSIAGNSYQEMINLGYDVNQAKAYATLTAASEVGLESLLGDISGLGGKMMPEKLTNFLNRIKGVDNALAQVAIKLGSHMGSEALEEGLQEVLDPWLKNMILGTDESVDWAEVGYSALLGALTAGILEGGSVTAGEYNVYTLGKDLKSSGVSVKELSDMGSKMSADSVAYRLAGQVDENTGAYKIGRLFNEVGATLTEMNQADISKSLVRKGIDPSDADIISRTLADVVNGKVLTDKQAAVLNANDLVSKTLMDVIINPNSTANQRMHGYNEMLMKLAEEKSRAEVMQNASAEVDPFMLQRDMEREVQRYHQVVGEKEDTNNQKASQINENSPIGGDIKVSETESASLQSTGEDVTIESVDSIKDGQMKLKLEDGRVVNAEDVLYETEADAIIYKAVADMNLNERAANLIVNSYGLGGNISAKAYVRGIDEAYRYGTFNYPVQQIANGPFASMLTEYQRNMAYNLGKLFEGKKVAVAEAKIREAAKQNKENGVQVSGKVHYDGIDQTKLTNIQKTSISALEKIAQVIGVDFHLFESSVDEQGKREGHNGWYDPNTNSIHIDIYAGQSGSGTILFTAAHELTHFIKDWSPARFKTLANFLMREYGKRNISVETLVQNQIAKAKRTGRDISYDTAYEEVIADSMEKMLSYGKIVENLSKLRSEDRVLHKKINDYIKDLAAKIKQIYNGLSPDSAEGRYVADMSDVIDELQKAFEASLIEAGENYKNAGGQSLDDGSVKMQIREIKGEKIVWIDNSVLTNKQMRSPKEVAKYIKTNIGKLYRVIEGGEKVYIGKDLPGEYTRSKYTSYLQKKAPALLMAKNTAISEIGEMIEIASNRRWEQTKHKASKDAKYGIYRYDTKFAFPIKDKSGKVISVKAYDANLLIINSSNGKKYLYDLIKIKENTAQALNLTHKEARKGSYKAAARSSASSQTITQGPSNVKQKQGTFTPRTLHAVVSDNNKVTTNEDSSNPSIQDEDSKINQKFSPLESIEDNRSKLGFKEQKEDEVRFSVRDKKLTADSTEQERYELLKDAKLKVAKVNEKAIQDIKLEDYNTKKKSVVLPGFKALARQLGILNVDLKNSMLQFPFRFSGKGLEVSLHHQLEYGGTYQDYVRAMSCFNDLVKNAVPIEVHTDKKVGTVKENVGLKKVYVLASAYRDGNSIVPIELEVKEFLDRDSSLYMAVVLTKINPEVLDTRLTTDSGEVSSLFSGFTISLQQLFQNVNTKDARFLKYIPDGFLNEAQKQAKQEALKKQSEEYAGYGEYKKETSQSVNAQSPGVTSEIEAGNVSLNESIHNDSMDVNIYSDRDPLLDNYSYDSLVSKPDMTVTILSSQIPGTRAEVIVQAKENAVKIGKLGEHGNPLVYVKDIDREVMLSNKGLRHGLDRRFDINAPVTLKAGEILQNAIQVNELTPSKSTIDTSYVLIGAAKNIKSEPYIVQFVINRATNEVTSVDVLYAINAKTNAIQSTKKESTGSLSPEITNSFATLTDSKISISKLLDYVNQYFPDVLSVNVLHHYGHTERPEGKLGKSAVYSDRDPLLEKVNASLEKENERLKVDIVDLKELLKIQKSITNGTKLTKSSVDTAARYLMNKLGSNGDKAELIARLTPFYEGLAVAKNLTWEEISEIAQPAVDFLVDNLSKNTQLDEYAVSVLKEIKSQRISLSDEQKSEVASQYGSYNDYRKSVLGSVTISDSNAIPLDQRWSELSTMYPDVFNADVVSGDQPAALVEAIDTLRSMDLSPVYERDMLEQEIRGEIYDSYWRVSTLKTVADVKQDQIRKLKGKHYAVMSKLRAEHKTTVSKLRSEYQEGLKAVKKEYRETAEAKQKEIIKHYQEARKRNVEGRHRTQMRHKIASVVKELNDLLLKETKDKHVPIELQKAVAEALDAVNMDTVGAESRIAKLEADLMKAKTPEKAQEIARTIERVRRMGDRMDERIRSLKDAYAKIVNSSDPLIANSYDKVIADKIESVMDSVMDTPLRDMTMQQLEDVYELYKMVRETVRNVNKAFKMNRAAGIREMGEAVMQELESEGRHKKQRTEAGRKASAFSWNNLKSIYAFKRIGSDTLTELYKNVRKGEDTWAVDMIEAKKFYDEQYKKYRYDSWDFDERYEFKSSGGKEFSLSLDQIMSLYAYSKRKQALAHLKEGGIVFDTNTEHVVKKWLKVPAKVKIEDAQTYQLSDDVLQKIIGKLSAKQKAFVDTMQEYLSSTMGEKGNEVSLTMYGIKLFKEKSYFPLKSAEQYLVKAREQQEVDVKIKNKGFTKELRENAQNPVVLTPFMDVWADHVDQMSMYHALTLPLEDFYRVYNYESRSEDGKEKYSINASIQSAHGIAATAYINQFLKDVNGGVIVDTRENITNGLISKFKKAAVLSSMSVVIQQPSAICRAWSMIDLKYFRPTADGMKHGQLWEEVKKYAPVAVIKEMGYFDTGMGRNARDLIKDQGYDGLLNKIKGFVKDGNYRDEVLSKLPGLADEVTWCAIWNATKRQVFHEHSNMNPRSEEFLKLVGEKFTDVITETQVYDSVFSRSANMRSKSKLMNMWTAFMAEPTTSINMLEEAMRQAKKGNKRAAARMVGSVFASVFLNSVLASLVYAARDDDEDDTFLEKYVASFISEMLEGVNPITYYPVLKDIWSIAQGYDVERTDMSLISSLAKSLERCTKVIGKDTSGMDEEELAEHGRQVEKAMWNAVDDFSSLLGIPIKNIRREIMAARSLTATIEKDMNGRETSWGSVMDKLSQTVKDATPIYSWMPDKKKTDKLYDAMVSGDTAYANRLKESYDTELAYMIAVRKALRDNDSRIRSAAQARISGDIQRYTSIAKEIIAEGFFTQDMVVTAINNEITMLNKTGSSKTVSDKSIGFYKAEDFGSAVLRNNATLANAVKTDIIQTAQENGKTLEEATRSFENAAKNDLKERLISGELSEDQVINALIQYCDIEQEEAQRKAIEWSFEADYGFSYSERGDAYKNGQISALELREVLMEIGGKSREEADLQIEVYDWQKEVPEYESITASAIKDYNENCNPVGISREQYYQAWRYYQDTLGDYDAAGESIPYSKVNKVMPYIDSLPLSSDQKTALALCWWSEGTVYKYKLW